jgi:hypothetical protein
MELGNGELAKNIKLRRTKGDVTLLRVAFPNSYFKEHKSPALKYLQYLYQKRELEYEKLIGGLLVGFDY